MFIERELMGWTMHEMQATSKTQKIAELFKEKSKMEVLKRLTDQSVHLCKCESA